jgi:predicted nucleic acid-binding protein
MREAMLDTSVVVALAHERLVLDDPPDEAVISVITLCELHHGVLAASDAKRPARLRTLDWVRHNCETLPLEDDAPPRYGQLMLEAHRATGKRPHPADVLIAATALARDLPVLTRDKDFEAFHGVNVVFV